MSGTAGPTPKGRRDTPRANLEQESLVTAVIPPNVAPRRPGAADVGLHHDPMSVSAWQASSSLQSNFGPGMAERHEHRLTSAPSARVPRIPDAFIACILFARSRRRHRDMVPSTRQRESPQLTGHSPGGHPTNAATLFVLRIFPCLHCQGRSLDGNSR